MGRRIALLGWSLESMEAMNQLGREYVVVAPAAFAPAAAEHGLSFVGWEFERMNERSAELTEELLKRDVKVAVPLYEECVEWAGAINAQLRDDPRLFNRYLLFRDKAMMKRKAQMSGIRVGVFEEADGPDDVKRFFERVNKAQLKLATDVNDPVHLKPLNAAGSVGHHLIRSAEDVERIPGDIYPCLLESHLAGQEFSCEAFVHKGKIRFLNITEYVHLGHSNFVPPSPKLWAQRDKIRAGVEQLIEAFEIEYGMIHPEWFISPDGKMNFGEVAARVPGGHIFELIQRAYGFNPFAGFALCCDPETTDAELDAFFPDEGAQTGHAGCLMVYPRGKVASKLEVPSELVDDPYFERHNLFVPATAKVAERVGFGNHYGTVYFWGDDPARMEQLLRQYEDVDFYSG